MGVKPASRASKATLIDQILREAGIETGTEERPKRPRRSTAASRNGAAAKADAAAATEGGEAPAAGSDAGPGATDSVQHTLPTDAPRAEAVDPSPPPSVNGDVKGDVKGENGENNGE